MNKLTLNKLIILILLIICIKINQIDSYLFNTKIIKFNNNKQKLLLNYNINNKKIKFNNNNIILYSNQINIPNILDEPMLDDFNKIYYSLKIYIELKKLNNNNITNNTIIKIPLKYEIPSTYDYPYSLHNFPLGKRLKRLTLSDKFKNDSPDKVKLIEDLGFQLDSKNILNEWEIIYEGLVAYKKNYGNLNIDNDFVIPDETSPLAKDWPDVTHGLRLGSRVCAIRNSGAHVRVDNERKKMLDDLGFLWNKPKKNKHMIDSTTNSSTTLDETSNDNNIRNTNVDDKFNLFLEGLIQFKTLNNHLNVPTSYIIPSNTTDYPEHLWNFKLGNRVSLIRSQGLFISSYPDRKQILDDIGFLWESPLKKKKKSNIEDTIIQDNIENIIDNNDNIIDNIIDPNNTISEINLDEYPVLTNFFQYNKNIDDEEKKLEENYKIKPERIYDLRLHEPEIKSLEQYEIDSSDDLVQYREEISKKLLVKINKYNEDENNKDYYPVEDIKYMLSGLPPPSLKGIHILKHLKHRIFEYDNFYFEDFYDVLYTYKQTFNHLNISKDFVLTERFLLEYPFFNSSYKDMKVGEYIESLRNGDFEGKYHKDRRIPLDSLGFDWGNDEKHLRFPFYPFYQALKLYYYLYADATPPEDYIIPDEDPWPHCLVGCPFGKWASYARLQKKTLAKYYPERVRILDALDFIWWIPTNIKLTEELE